MSKIEVERKFHITEEEVASLLEGAEYLGEKTYTDICFDSENFGMTTKDQWLRRRNGRYDYKMSFKKQDKTGVDNYHEYTGDEVRKHLKLGAGDMEKELAKAGIKPIAKIVTTRKEYKKGEFGIVIDSMDFGYQIGEIELVVSEKDVEKASKKIMTFANSYGLKLDNNRGKFLEYVCRYRPEHRKALIQAGFWGL